MPHHLSVALLQLREEKKALRDTRRELEKMAIGRHIGDRGHVMQKQRNTRTNEVNQHQDLIGMDEGMWLVLLILLKYRKTGAYLTPQTPGYILG